MFCHNCGEQLGDDVKFCLNCGTSQIDTTDTIQTDTPEVEQSYVELEQIVANALRFNKVLVDRESFLKEIYAFRCRFSSKIIDQNSIIAGVSLGAMDRAAKKIITYSLKDFHQKSSNKTLLKVATSFVPMGGVALMLGKKVTDKVGLTIDEVSGKLIPLLINMQKLSYIYGRPTLDPEHRAHDLTVLLLNLNETMVSYYIPFDVKGRIMAVMTADKTDKIKTLKKIGVDAVEKQGETVVQSALKIGAKKIFENIPGVGGVVEMVIAEENASKQMEKLKLHSNIIKGILHDEAREAINQLKSSKRKAKGDARGSGENSMPGVVRWILWLLKRIILLPFEFTFGPFLLIFDLVTMKKAYETKGKEKLNRIIRIVILWGLSLLLILLGGI